MPDARKKRPKPAHTDGRSAPPSAAGKGAPSACLSARFHALRAPSPGLTESSPRPAMTTRTARRRAASGGASRQGWTSARMMPSPANRAATESTTETRA
jgi:hypothetical protein